ncbi:MAG: hypothetical protein Q7U13_10915 [Rhodoferax sp.]|nr:hypothetical protein [Rhodoferax sp.]
MTGFSIFGLGNGFTNALAAKGDFFAAGFAVTLEVVFVATTGAAGAVAALGAAGGTATLTGLAVVIFLLVVTMESFPLSKRFIQFISFGGLPSI